MNDPRMRDAFEARWYRNPKSPVLWRTTKENDYENAPYKDSGMNSKWEAWKEAWTAAMNAQVPELISIEDRVAELILKYKTVRAAATAVNLDPGYLHCLGNGSKNNPSKETLRKLSLYQETRYMRASLESMDDAKVQQQND